MKPQTQTLNDRRDTTQTMMQDCKLLGNLVLAEVRLVRLHKGGQI